MQESTLIAALGIWPRPRGIRTTMWQRTSWLQPIELKLVAVSPQRRHSWSERPNSRPIRSIALTE
jgi:hypothetical protein